MNVRKFALIAMLVLAGCGLWSGGVRSRAVAYYDFILGGSVTTNYSTYLSPAYRATFEPEALDELNRLMKPNMDSSERFEHAGPDDIVVEARAKFAFTYVKPELGYPYSSMEPVKWVKVGNRWYVYNGFTPEVEAYGHFPVELQLPVVERGDKLPPNLPPPRPKPEPPPVDAGDVEAEEVEAEAPEDGAGAEPPADDGDAEDSGNGGSGSAEAERDETADENGEPGGE